MKEQEFNLKNRVTGAVILVVGAVLLVSLAIDDRPQLPIPSVSTNSDFTSKIVTQSEAEKIVNSASTPNIDQDNTDLDNDVYQTRENVTTDLPSSVSVYQPEENQPGKSERRSVNLVLDRNIKIDQSPLILNGSQQSAPTTAVIIDKPRIAVRKTRWILRVGAFKRKNNADQVVQQLEEEGFNTGQAKITGSTGQVIIRVWAGPFNDQKEAVRAKTTVNKKLGLNGFISKLQS